MKVTVIYEFEGDELFDIVEHDEDFEDADDEIEYDEDGVAWWFDADEEVWYYFDEDEDDWVEYEDDEDEYYNLPHNEI